MPRSALTSRGETRLKPWVYRTILSAALAIAVIAIIVTVSLAASPETIRADERQSAQNNDSVTEASHFIPLRKDSTSSESPSTFTTSSAKISSSSPSIADHTKLRANWIKFLNPLGMDTSLNCSGLRLKLERNDLHVYPFKALGRVWTVFKPKDNVCVVVQTHLSSASPNVTQETFSNSLAVNMELIPKIHTQLPFNLTFSEDLDLSENQLIFNDTDLIFKTFKKICSVFDTIVPIKQCKPSNGQYLVNF